MNDGKSMVVRFDAADRRLLERMARKRNISLADCLRECVRECAKPLGPREKALLEAFQQMISKAEVV